MTPSPPIGNLPESSVPRFQPPIAVNPASSPVSLASNATQFYVTPPPPPGNLPGSFPRSQPPVTIKSGSSHPAGFTISLLQFCHQSVRVCFGCSQSLNPGGDIPNPPHDLTITSKMQRRFCDPVTGEVKSRKRLFLI